jgi:hypothetical protein
MRTSSALSGILTSRPYIPDAAYMAMCSARQGFNESWNVWLAGRPDPDFIAEEARGSINVIRDLAAWHGVLLR